MNSIRSRTESSSRSDAAVLRSMLFPAAAAAVVLALIAAFPQESFRAGLKGVAIWWDVLFPSLFPFLVVSELMLGFGIVHFFGTLLDPMMRPLFRLPGPGGFVMAMGFASGYPVGARLTAQLWDSGLVNRSESERLVAFTTTADPIFLIGAVAVGFFHDVRLAPILALSHYGGAVLLGLLLRLRLRGGDDAPERPAKTADARPLLVRAFAAMHRARLADGRAFGHLLLDGVRSALRLVIVVGGLVVFFSVVIEVLAEARVVTALQHAASALLGLFSIPAPLSAAVVNGLFEVTLGAKAAGQPSSGVPLHAQVVVAAFGLSWAGLSVHAQIMSLVSHMPVRYAPYAAAKAAQGVLSAAIAYFAWPALGPRGGAAPAWAAAAEPGGWTAAQTYLPSAALLFAAVLVLLPAAYAVWLALRFAFRIR
ncbi:nucleoside recognition domain-containing protein [Paenibacillus sp.]|uniref:nucleoside recognition domain-containing protein n=1 Tax=Paenibacillus sp. TaxID=58172 RepID=UPI002D48CDB8|nr:nucleoside recognition domain-containing protein [Paenibacillus sp.]HZG84593.1 nucleoside recognition domain-containing protein [Paenibacillus sp.]